MRLGYDLEEWYQYGVKLPINIDLERTCHHLYVGKSGSGKSVSLKYGLYQAVCSYNVNIWLVDFKSSEDFVFYKDTAFYYDSETFIEGINKFYNMFLTLKQQKKRSEVRQILVLDEYASMILYLTSKDKKEAERIKSIISEMLMQSRYYRLSIYICLQRADALYFPQGSRLNFMCIVHLGKMDSEQKAMLFPGYELPDTIYKPGEGIVYIDGRDIQQIKFPWVEDIRKLEARIKETAGCLP